jgi:hypothetical protein
VGALEHEVRSRMIEGRLAQLDDIRAPAEVLGVAGLALRGVDAGEPAVEPGVPTHVRAHFLVACHAELGLLGPIGPVVALRALGFELGVGSRHLAGHQQGLDPGGQCRHRTDERQHGEHSGNDDSIMAHC